MPKWALQLLAAFVLAKREQRRAGNVLVDSEGQLAITD